MHIDGILRHRQTQWCKSEARTPCGSLVLNFQRRAQQARTPLTFFCLSFLRTTRRASFGLAPLCLSMPTNSINMHNYCEVLEISIFTRILVSQMTSSLITATARATTTITLHEVSTGGGFLTGIQKTARSVSLGLCPGVRYGGRSLRSSASSYKRRSCGDRGADRPLTSTSFHTGLRLPGHV